MLVRSRVSALATVIAIGALALPAGAQITTGTVVGTVEDAQGGVVPGVTVVLVSQTRGTKMIPIVTNDQGSFTVPNVTADTYTIEVTMSGFKTITRRDIRVSGGDRVTVPTLTLEIGGATETVDVVGEAPLIQAQSGERSYSVTAEQVANLPFENRSFTALAALAPGMDGGNRQGGGGFNNVMMDGVSTMDTGNNAPVLFLNTDAIAEVKVLTSNYQAEYGRSSGAQISAVTKSGTNRFHGSVYDVERDSRWNSASWVNKELGQPKARTDEQDFGYTIGGPIGKPGGNNKLFFFQSTEWRPRQTGGENQRNFRVPTALERNGDFSQTRDNNGNLYNLIRDPFSGNPCTATNTSGCYQDGGVLGKIPADRLYAPGLAILRQYPMPNLPDVAGQNFNLTSIDPLQKRRNAQTSFRVDYQPLQSLRFNFKWNGERQRKQIFAGSLPGYNDSAVPKPIITAISTTVNYTINPTTFIEGTYGLTQNELAGCTNLQIMCNGTQGQGPAVPMGPNSNKFTAGLGDLPVLFPGGLDMNPDYYEYKILQDMGAPFFVNGRIEMPPQISWNGRVANQPPSINYPGWLNINRAQDVAISLTKVTGRHTWKMGYYQNHSFKAQHRGQAGPGTLNFQNDAVGVNPLDTSFPFANAATGTFSSMTQLSRFVEGGWVYDNNEFFIQDNWKVNNRLTLDYGMRFVHQDPQYDNHFQSANFRPETFDPAQMPRLYEWTCITTFPCSGANRRAWDPVTGELLAANISSLAVGTIIPGTGNDLNGVNRVGEGITKKGYFWPALAFAPRFGMAYDLSGTQSFIVRGGAGLFYDRPEGNTVYPLISNPPYARQVTVNYGDLRALGSGGLTFRGAPSLGSYEYHSDLPSSVQWNAGVQFSLPWASAFDAEYVGQHSYNTLIPNQGSQINQLDLGTLYLPSSQDPTQAVTTLGSNVRPVNALRAFRGWQNISHHISRNWRTYHSIQMSLNRRFRDGLSAQVNYTLSLYDHQSVTARWEHVPGTTEFRERADQKKAEELFGTGKIPHNLRANFVWDLPDWSPSSTALRGVAAVINDWQLAGIYTFRSGDTYSIGYSYQNGMGNSQLTGSPDYAARVRLVGDPGSGCSDNQLMQFNTAAAVGPDPFSDGLESSNSYLRQCATNVWDLNVQRHIRLGGGRTVSLQVQMFNAFNNVMFSNRQANMTLNNHIDKVIQNSPFDADGNPIATRILPNGSAGFGVVTNARALRTMQARIGFTF